VTELQYRRRHDEEEGSRASGAVATVESRRTDATSATAPCLSWLAAAIDELDYGMLLVAPGARVVHANHTAVVELDADHPLQWLGDQLGARCPKDAAPLNNALAAAASRGLRRLLTIGEGTHRLGIAVVPLGAASPASGAPTLVVLGKQRMCEHLSVQGYARTHGLTAAEARVLLALCGGDRPDEVAARLDIAISTVRTQIGSIRSKTGMRSINALLQQLAMLPPIMGSLRGMRPKVGTEAPLSLGLLFRGRAPL
jgi:DNA-binding CsgD family transcriptional regulator